MICTCLLFITAFPGLSPDSKTEASESQTLRYRSVLHSPGGELPFFLELDKANSRAWIINGTERIEIPEVTLANKVVLSIDHYDSKIEATRDLRPEHSNNNGRKPLRGVWRKRIGEDQWTQLDFSARLGPEYRFKPIPKPAHLKKEIPPVSGRWSVKFSKSEETAIGLFKESPDGDVQGTFLTNTGDYRYLSGSYEYGRLRLSCFDGAHAFLFDAQMQPDGVLKGDFWSRDVWHETWTARRDDQVRLPDGFSLTKWTNRAALKNLRFPDLDGNLRSPADPAFAGKARIIEVFGSWCPNCHDSSAHLVELDRRYRDRGLSIVGLAFEVTGDLNRDAKQVRRFAKRHNVQYPILIAGLADKKKASGALPILDEIRAYPTTIFLRADGTIHAVHTGFSGPATGEAHRRLRRHYETIIEELLAR
ncbi:MAG: TlpA family protein disulfide reductase [Phycisphaerales bacterium]|nr:TlpA family protein disulfide reductase [Phycisphaerales bacterium]